MADQTAEVIDFIRDRHPEISVDDIGKCLSAISEWLAIQMERTSG